MGNLSKLFVAHVIALGFVLLHVRSGVWAREVVSLKTLFWVRKTESFWGHPRLVTAALSCSQLYLRSQHVVCTLQPSFDPFWLAMNTLFHRQATSVIVFGNKSREGHLVALRESFVTLAGGTVTPMHYILQ